MPFEAIPNAPRGADMLVIGPIMGVFQTCFYGVFRDKTIFTKRPKSAPQRDAVAKDESAADRRADAQIVIDRV
eukprot:3374799-Pleurochrysis_carterae.AAC.1